MAVLIGVGKAVKELPVSQHVTGTGPKILLPVAPVTKGASILIISSLNEVSAAQLLYKCVLLSKKIKSRKPDVWTPSNFDFYFYYFGERKQCRIMFWELDQW